MYNPYIQQPQFAQQNQMQTYLDRLNSYSTQQPQQTTQLIQVNGIESAKAYPTLPNSTVALFDSNDDILYIKSTDASNFPTIRKFRFKEESLETQAQNNIQYVTIEEFNKFKEEILNGKQFVSESTTSTKSKSKSTTNDSTV